MKLIRIVFVVVLVTIGCRKASNRPQPETDIVLVRDITDNFIVQPELYAILHLYDFPNHPNQAAKFREVLLTDRITTPVEDIQISDGQTTEKDNDDENTDFRENIVSNFYDGIGNAINDFHKSYAPTGQPLKHSECFATIAAQLDWLIGSKASQKILIIYGDLAENNEMFSCYTETGLYMLQNKPEKVAKTLLHRHSLPENLTGVTCYFVYLPPTSEADKRYVKMTGIYKKLFCERGARVVIQTTNKNYEP